MALLFCIRILNTYKFHPYFYCLLCFIHSFTFCNVTTLGGHRDGPVTSGRAPLPGSGHALGGRGSQGHSGRGVALRGSGADGGGRWGG